MRDPWPGIKPAPPSSEGRVLTSGPPGMSLPFYCPMDAYKCQGLVTLQASFSKPLSKVVKCCSCYRKKFFVQSLSCVQLFVTPWSAACQAPLSSTTLRVCSNSCLLSWWCCSTISSSVPPTLFAFNLSQHLGLFQWIGSSHLVAKILELQLQHQSFQWIVLVYFI